MALAASEVGHGLHISAAGNDGGDVHRTLGVTAGQRQAGGIGGLGIPGAPGQDACDRIPGTLVCEGRDDRYELVTGAG